MFITLDMIPHNLMTLNLQAISRAGKSWIRSMHDIAINKWIFIALILGIAICMFVVAFKTMSGTEAILLSVVLTILSMIASWLASRFYAELGFNASLRTYALKASEKVDNLSNELGRLAAFLQTSVEDEEPDVPERLLLERDMTIGAAIHIINTLKSVNDRSLSDWEGVIGQEITAQRERREAREEELVGLINRVQKLYSSQVATEEKNQGADHEAILRRQLDDLRRELRLLAAQVGGVPLKPSGRVRNKKVEVELPCPECGNPLSYRQRSTLNGAKLLRCKKCDAEVVSRYSKSGFNIFKREKVNEPIECPTCTTTFNARVDNFTGPTNVRCEKCGSEIRVTRDSKGLSIRVSRFPSPIAQKSGDVVDEELLARIKAEMPPQPWPPYASEQLAKRLGLDLKAVRSAVRTLIIRGDFYAQVDGQLFVLKEEGELAKDPSLRQLEQTDSEESHQTSASLDGSGDLKSNESA